MSPRSSSRGTAHRRAPAPVFAALGDETRLALVVKLCGGQPRSIAQLTEAITKHLRILENAAIVHSIRRGRESLFEFDPQPMEEIKEYLDLVSEQWNQALSRLKSVVED